MKTGFHKVVRIFGKTLLWTLAVIILIVFTLATLLQSPPLQTLIAHKGARFVSEKTGMHVSVRSILIALPDQVKLSDLLCLDRKNDTLLFAGELKLNIGLRDLLRNEINIESIFLSEVKANVSRQETDSFFNYQPFIDAFTKNTNEAEAADPKKSKLSIGSLELHNITAAYIDNYDGISITGRLKNLELKTDSLDFENNRYKVKQLLIDGFTGRLAILKEAKPGSGTTEKNSLPVVSAKKITLRNTLFALSDKTSDLNMTALASNAEFENPQVDINSEYVYCNYVNLQNSGFVYFSTNDEKNEEKKDTLVDATANSKGSNWKVKVGRVALQNNTLRFHMSNSPVNRLQFNHEHMIYDAITLKAKDFYYSGDTILAELNSFSCRDSAYFSVQQLSGKFKMDGTTIAAGDLHVKTRLSTVDANAALGFKSLKAIGDSPGALRIQSNISNATVHSSDILYFSPALNKITFFKNRNRARVSGRFNGSVNNLKAAMVNIITGAQTKISFNGTVKNATHPEKIFIETSDLKLKSGRSDIYSLAGKDLVPASVSLPDTFSAEIAFKGHIKNFTSACKVKSTYGNITAQGMLSDDETYSANMNTDALNLGALIKNKSIGVISSHVKVKGHGLDTASLNGRLVAEVSSVYAFNYNYQNLSADIIFNKKTFEGQVTMKDKNLDFDAKGLVNLDTSYRAYQLTAKVNGANLKELKLMKSDLRVAFNAVSDIKGSTMNNVNGTLKVSNIVLAKDGKKHVLDSFLFAGINQTGRSELSIKSAVVGLEYKGTFAPEDLVKEIKQNLNHYFPFSAEKTPPSPGAQQLQFEITVRDHPVISEIFFKDLKEFAPATIKGSYSSENRKMDLDCDVPKLVYGDFNLNKLHASLGSDASRLDYQVTFDEVSNQNFGFDHVIAYGNVQNGVIAHHLSSVNEKGYKKLVLHAQVRKENENFKLHLEPGEFYLANEPWSVSEDNFILIGKNVLKFHHFVLSQNKASVAINSPNNDLKGDVDVEVQHFDLSDISKLANKDTLLIQGEMSGKVNFKKVNGGYGIISDLSVWNLAVKEILIGHINLTARNTSEGRFDLALALTGQNELHAKGSLFPSTKKNTANFKIDIKHLEAKTIEAFSMGEITNARGHATGEIDLKGNLLQPEINGSLTFHDFAVNPTLMNSTLMFNNQTVTIKNDAVHLNSFVIADEKNNQAVINGSLRFSQLTNPSFSLAVKANNFLLLNTVAKQNHRYYGKLIVDGRVILKGTLNNPVITSNLEVKNGSNFTYVFGEEEASTDKGEGVVIFIDSADFHPIITRNETVWKSKSDLMNFDVSSVVQIQKGATVRLLPDPGSADSLTVKGEGVLSLVLDPGGRVSVTGTYLLNEGFYLASVENVVKKKFKIEPGGSITWNGDPLDAEVRLNAIYVIRTSPIDLVTDQLAEGEKNQYRQRYPFEVHLKLRGQLVKPDISFEIKLANEYKGTLGGMINARLEQLNENPSALNKQVFALLVLNRFIQENPLQTETDATANAARTTVGKFLSAQLNRLSSKAVPGVDIQFDVQSYEDYSAGKSQGRTEVGIGVSKQLFHERVSVQVGGSVDVEGEKANQNTASDITGDVILEYKITPDGRYRLKGFRNNQYAGIIEGQITETGAGIIYVRDFNKWNELFKPAKKNESRPDSLWHARVNR